MKRWRRLLRSALRLLGGLLALWALWLLRVATLELPPPRTPDGSAAARGALHVHTTRSDGRAPVEEVARHAREAGLDFIVLADHNVTPDPAAEQEGVLVIPGVELSTSAGHILAYGGGEVAGWPLRRDDPVGAARASGSLVSLSHPVNLRRPWEGPFEGIDAMEVLSADSAYRVALRSPLTLLTAVLSYPASPDVAVLHLLDGVDEARERFHRALAEGGLQQGFCGHDAHGLPGYPPVFRVLGTHLAPGALAGDEAEVRAASVIEALREGRFFCAVDGLADASGFVLDTTGEEIVARLGAGVPAGARARLLLFRDGVEVAAVEGSEVRAASQPGRWHAEVELARPWLLGARRFLWILSGTSLVPVEPPVDDGSTGEAVDVDVDVNVDGGEPG
ncbi:MAG: CehA/McbA family metallohydrolase [Deltaproteobacteria bacterium]|nr:CehA/McbA family metallohydrolase [Deltaproteobacteria bacterium]